MRAACCSSVRQPRHEHASLTIRNVEPTQHSTTQTGHSLCMRALAHEPHARRKRLSAYREHDYLGPIWGYRHVARLSFGRLLIALGWSVTSFGFVVALYGVGITAIFKRGAIRIELGR